MQRAGLRRAVIGGRDATLHSRRRELREVAGARQRLRDRRATRAPVRADAGADPRDLRAAHGRRRRRDPAAVASPRAPAASRGCGSSIPTARRRSCRATARARRSCTCAAAAGPTRDTFSIQTAAGRDPPDDHLADHVHGRHGPGAPAESPTIPSGADGRSRRADRRRAPMALPARAGRQPAVRDRVDDRGRARRARPAARSARRSSTTSCSRTARTSRGTRVLAPGAIRARIFERGVGETLGQRHRGDRRRGRPRPRRRATRRSRSCSTAASSTVEVGEDLHVKLTGWAVPVFRGHARR